MTIGTQSCAGIDSQDQSKLAEVALIVAFRTSLLTLLTALLLSLLWLLRGALALRALVLDLGLWYLLLMLDRSLLCLLPLMLRCRDILLRRRLRDDRPLSLSGALLRRWCAQGLRSGLRA